MTLCAKTKPRGAGTKIASTIYREMAIGKPNGLDSQISHL